MSDLTGANAINIIARLRHEATHARSGGTLWDDAADLIEALSMELARMAEEQS